MLLDKDFFNAVFYSEWEFAIEFAEWCRDIAVRETPYSTDFTNDWELRSEQKIVTTKELLEMYKKEKGL